MSRDLRDPVAMGEALLKCRSIYTEMTFSHLADAARPLDSVRDYRDETTLEKYGEHR